MIIEKKEFNVDSAFLINAIFSFFPVSFIFGNLITNLNVVLFCILGIFHLKSRNLNIKFNFIIKIIFTLFIIIFISTSLSFLKDLYTNTYSDYSLTKLVKSILFFRFFIFLLIIYYLSELDIINFKYFFISAASTSLFISADVIFQYIFGYNIVGIEKIDFYFNTSFFGDELISGSYIQDFSFFAILFVAWKFKDSVYSKFIIAPLIVSILGAGIMLSGNRMPLLLFFFVLFLLYFYNKSLRTTALISILFLSMTFGSIWTFMDNELQSRFVSAASQSKKTITALYEKITSHESEILKKEQGEFLKETRLEDDKKEGEDYLKEKQGYRKLFSTAIETWKLHKILGNGIKSFRKDCRKIITEQKRGMCSNHPHNYYLEILTDLGVVGFAITLIISSIFIGFLIKNYNFLNQNNLKNLFLLATTISLFLEVFPIKGTGSIFTTNNATYIIILSGILLSYKNINKLQKF